MLSSRLAARAQEVGTAIARDALLESALKESEGLALRAGGVPSLLVRGVRLRRIHSSLRGGALDDYVQALRGLLRFRVYERCFALWHAFHLPLCFLLFGAAAIHVVAVHLY